MKCLRKKIKQVDAGNVAAGLCERSQIARQGRRIAGNVRDTRGRHAREVLDCSRRKTGPRGIEHNQLRSFFQLCEKLLDVRRSHFDYSTAASDPPGGIRLQIARRRRIRFDSDHAREVFRQRHGKQSDSSEEIKRQPTVCLVHGDDARKLAGEKSIHLEE